MLNQFSNKPASIDLLSVEVLCTDRYFLQKYIEIYLAWAYNPSPTISFKIMRKVCGGKWCYYRHFQ